MAIDYSKLNEITVKNQDELDMIPLDYKGRIYIDFGTEFEYALVRNKYYQSVVARNNSSVVARGNSSVVAWGNSSVVAWDNSRVEAGDNSSVVARNNSSVVARNNSIVEAWDNSSVVAWDNSRVEAGDNSSVVAWDNSIVEAGCNVQVVDKQLNGGKIQISGNARIVYMPKNIEDFMNFFGIKHTKTKATFYKAVKKKSGKYVSSYDDKFKYIIGKTKTCQCDVDTERYCSNGIHISHLNWALNFGKDWDNLAILEVETSIKDIVLPKNSDGKARTSKVKVIREVPLSECGLYGKILEKRLKNNGRIVNNSTAFRNLRNAWFDRNRT